MAGHSKDTGKIAKNTVILYIRLIFIMALNLYTSRVVLEVLGIDDFGIYNVVGGLVMMFTLLSGSIQAAISRFLTYELGNDDRERLKRVFSTSITILLFLGGAIVLLGETLGVWLLNTVLNIPVERMTAANWVLQFSLLTFIANLIIVPYNAAIIAHEKASAFAIISIIEAVSKLAIIYLVMATPFDSLIVYGFFMLLLALCLLLIYIIYCRRSFDECRFQFVYDKKLLREMNSFAGWNFIGASSSLLSNQGVNLLINVFFSVSVNAARGIVNQVDGAVRSLVNNITLATDPQIIKSYAENNREYMIKLSFMASKYSFFLAMTLFIPILLEARKILGIWLVEYPDECVLFIRLTIVNSLLFVISNPLVTIMLATGDIKKYQIIVGGIGVAVFFVTYIAYLLGAPVESTYYILIVCTILQLIARLFLLKSMVDFPVKDFVYKVLNKDMLVFAVAFIIPFLLYVLIEPSLMRFFIVTFISIICSASAIYVLGMGEGEKQMLLNRIKIVRERYAIKK